MEGIYPEEFIKSLLISLGFLKKCYIDVLDSNTNHLSRNYWFLLLISIFFSHYITLTMYIVKIFTEGIDPFEEAYMIPVWLLTTQELFGSIIVIQKRKELRAVIEHLGSIWRTTDLTENQSKKKKSALKQLNLGQMILYKMALITSCQYMLLPLGETVVKIFFLAQDAELALPFACVYPFAVDNWPIYLGVLAFQIYNIFHVLYMYLGSKLLLVALSTYLSIQFELLQEDLVNIKPINNRKKTAFDFNDEIIEWSAYSIEEFVKLHQDVILLTQQLNAVFNKMVFLNMLFSTLIVCFFAVAVKISTGIAYMLNNFGAIVIVMFTVFIVCYCSELLSASSTGIAQSAVKNLWYKGDIRYQTTICFIIMRSQRPCTLRSLNYSSISMKTFNKVLKTTYSYFSVASQIYDARD